MTDPVKTDPATTPATPAPQGSGDKAPNLHFINLLQKINEESGATDKSKKPTPTPVDWPKTPNPTVTPLGNQGSNFSQPFMYLGGNMFPNMSPSPQVDLSTLQSLGFPVNNNGLGNNMNGLQSFNFSPITPFNGMMPFSPFGNMMNIDPNMMMNAANLQLLSQQDPNKGQANQITPLTGGNNDPSKSQSQGQQKDNNNGLNPDLQAQLNAQALAQAQAQAQAQLQTLQIQAQAQIQALAQAQAQIQAQGQGQPQNQSQAQNQVQAQAQLQAQFQAQFQAQLQAQAQAQAQLQALQMQAQLQTQNQNGPKTPGQTNPATPGANTGFGMGQAPLNMNANGKANEALPNAVIPNSNIPGPVTPIFQNNKDSKDGKSEANKAPAAAATTAPTPTPQFQLPPQMQFPGQIPTPLGMTAFPGQLPGQLTGQLPGQLAQLPGQLQSQLARQLPGQMPGQLPGQLQNQLSTQNRQMNNQMPKGPGGTVLPSVKSIFPLSMPPPPKSVYKLKDVINHDNKIANGSTSLLPESELIDDATGTLSIRPLRYKKSDERYWLVQQEQISRRLKSMGFKPISSPNGTYKCSLCKAEFPTGLLCTRHGPEHLPGKPFQCKSCFTRFKRSDSLQRHIKTRCKKNHTQ